MTADYGNDRRRRRLVVLVGLVLAVVASAAVYYLVTRSSTPQPQVTMRTVVVAAVNIPARQQIRPEMVTTVTVPDSSVLALAAADPLTVVGKVTVVDITAGQAITANLFGTGTAAGLAILGPGETVAPDSPIWRAVSVTVPRDRAVGGLLTVGDHVDLFVTLAPQIFDPNGPAEDFTDPGHPHATTGAYYSTETTKVTWTNLEVLQVDKDNQVYILKVDEAQAEQIAHVQAIGASFTIGLRPPGDDRSVDPAPYGQTTNNLIDIFGFIIPQQINVGSPGPQPSPSASSSPSAAP